jgi:hypothetical protein
VDETEAEVMYNVVYGMLMAKMILHKILSIASEKLRRENK